MTQRKRSRYQEKLRGAPKKTQQRRICAKCVCVFCVCKVDTSQFFQVTPEVAREWYGD